MRLEFFWHYDHTLEQYWKHTFTIPSKHLPLFITLCCNIVIIYVLLTIKLWLFEHVEFCRCVHLESLKKSCIFQTIYGSQLEVVTDAGHMVMIETPDTLNRITHQFIEEGWIDQTPSNRRSSSLQNIEESSHLPDRNKSPHLERIPSRSSHMSIRSAKSVKSSKSMPRGLLTMAN